MPSIEDNISCWGHNYDWAKEGDEWSGSWGGTSYLWYGTIFPRIMSCIPAGTIVEIAPGYGRCTQYLITLCHNLHVVDLNKNCIDHCKNRFSRYNSVRYHVNNGKTLEMIPDGSADFIFSWDSLVHCESDILESYIGEFARIIKPNGFGFIHHSNIGQYFNNSLKKMECENNHARAETMSAPLFREYCNKNGLLCINQEVVNWGGSILNDCFSVFVKTNETSRYQCKYCENADFGKEVEHIHRIAEMYTFK